MTTNKERIEGLEAGLGGVQDGMQQLELAVTDKLHYLKETINKLSEVMDRELPPQSKPLVIQSYLAATISVHSYIWLHATPLFRSNCFALRV